MPNAAQYVDGHAVAVRHIEQARQVDEADIAGVGIEYRGLEDKSRR